MPVASGRGSAGRNVTVTTASASTAVTAPAGTFDTARDVGRPITGPGIAPGTTLTAVASATAATLSAAAGAGFGTGTATLGPLAGAAGRADELAYGFRGWSPESASEASAPYVHSTTAGQNEPSRVTDPNTPYQRRWKA